MHPSNCSAITCHLPYTRALKGPTHLFHKRVHTRLHSNVLASKLIAQDACKICTTTLQQQTFEKCGLHLTDLTPAPNAHTTCQHASSTLCLHCTGNVRLCLLNLFRAWLQPSNQHHSQHSPHLGQTHAIAQSCLGNIVLQFLEGSFKCLLACASRHMTSRNS